MIQKLMADELPWILANTRVVCILGSMKDYADSFLASEDLEGIRRLFESENKDAVPIKYIVFRNQQTNGAHAGKKAPPEHAKDFRIYAFSKRKSRLRKRHSTKGTMAPCSMRVYQGGDDAASLCQQVSRSLFWCG